MQSAWIDTLYTKKGYLSDQGTYERVLSFISHQQNYLRLQFDTTCIYFRMVKMKNTGGIEYSRPSISAVLHPWIQPTRDQKYHMICCWLRFGLWGILVSMGIPGSKGLLGYWILRDDWTLKVVELYTIGARICWWVCNLTHPFLVNSVYQGCTCRTLDMSFSLVV